MTIQDDLVKMWDKPLTNVRNGIFGDKEDRHIRDVLSRVTIDSENVPKEMVKYLWFIPIFLDWQKDRVSYTSRSNMESYHALNSWVITRIGELFGDP
jgi:hypothetical protein